MSEMFKALNFAVTYHGHDEDKIGKPVILHPLMVMMRMETEQEKTLALLHDVIEDTHATFNDLRRNGFSDDTIASLDAITRREGEKYFDYIDRLSRDELATKVKIQDLQDNMAREHPSVSEKKSLTKRYMKALSILEERLPKFHE